MKEKRNSFLSYRDANLSESSKRTQTVEFPCSEGSVWHNATKRDFTPSFPVWSSKREAKPDFGETSSPGLQSDSTSKGEEKLGYVSQLKAFPSGHPHIAEAS